MKSENRYRKLIEQAADGIYIIETDGKFSLVNTKLCEMLGYSEDELLNLNIIDTYTEEQKESGFKKLKEMTKGNDLRFERPMKRKDGSTFISEISVTKIDNGKLQAIIHDITQRKLNEEKIKESEEKFRILFENSRDPIILVNTFQRIFNCSLSAVKIMEAGSKEELIGLSIVQISPEYQPDGQLSPQKLEKYLRQVFISGSIEFEWLHKKLNGKEFLVEVSLALLTLDSQKILMASWRDITQRKQIEKEIQEREQRLRDIIDNAPFGAHLYELQADGSLIFIGANPSADWILKIDHKQLINKAIEEAFPGLVGTEIPDRYRCVASSGEKYEADQSSYDSQGVRGTYDVHAFQTGKNRMAVFFRDITERKRAEEALFKSDKLYRTLAHNYPNGAILLFNSELRYLVADGKSVTELGMSKEIIEGKTIWEVHPDDIVRPIEEVFKRTLAGEEFIIEFERANHIWEMYHLPIYDEKGEIFAGMCIANDITDRKKKESIILQNEERYKRLVESVTDYIYSVRIEAGQPVATTHGPGCETVTGYTSEELRLDLNLWYQMVFDEDKPIVEKLVKDIVSGVEVFAVEHRIIHKSGSIKWVRNTPVLKHNKDGVLISYDGLISDITEKKIAEEKLKQTVMELNAIFRALPDLYFLMEKDGTILNYKAGYSVETYVPPESFINKKVQALLPDDVSKKFTDAMQEISAAKSQVQIEYSLQMSGGERFYEARIIPLENEQMIALIRDITTRKLSEVALLENEEKYRQLFEVESDALFLVDDETDSILEANTAATLLYGYSHEEFLQMKTADLSAQPNDTLNFSIQKDLFHIPVRYHKKKYGTIFPVEITAGRLIWHGRPAHLPAVRDITKRINTEVQLENYRMRLEELIKERTKELEDVNFRLQEEIIKQKESEEIVKLSLEKEKELSDMKSKFISIASHEFRTPLTTVLSSTELLERYGRSWDIEKYKKQTERIKKSVKNLTHLMDQVLIISRADTGKTKFEPKKVDLKRLCENLLDDVQILLTERHSIKCDFDINDGYYLIDEKLFKFIVLNLLSNAIKYSPSGGEIGYKVKSLADKIVIEVSDKGIGIPDENQQHLFEAFSRGSNVGEIHGTGLGMSIIKRAVDTYNGSIEFESKVNIGSKFIVQLPIIRE